MPGKSTSVEARSLNAQAAALTRWAMNDPKPALAHVRAGFMLHLMTKVDPDGTLPEGERIRRAERLRKAHCLKMAVASAKARAERKAAKSAGSQPRQPARQLTAGGVK